MPVELISAATIDGPAISVGQNRAPECTREKPVQPADTGIADPAKSHLMAFLKGTQAGILIEELCRKGRFSDARFYHD